MLLVKEYKKAERQEVRSAQVKASLRDTIIQQIKANNINVINELLEKRPGSLINSLDKECRIVVINLAKGRLAASCGPEINGFSVKVWNRAVKDFIVVTYCKSRVENEEIAKSLARVYTNHNGVFIDDEFYSF